MNGLELCAGVGGIELGLRMAMPGVYRCVGRVERDSFAASLLVARMAEAALDPAPLWDSLEAFPGHLYRGKVDLISAGFPCQPWSCAGQRRGLEDERWLWPDIARVVRDVGPRYVFLENVRGLLMGGLGPVLGDLADLGFDAEWSLFSAAEVGAPHRRQRVFVLAHANGGREPTGPGRLPTEPPCRGDAVANANGGALRDEPRRSGREGRARAAEPGHAGASVADPGERRRIEGRRGLCRRESDLERGGDSVGHPGGPGLEDRGRDAARQPFPAPWPPGPHDAAGWEEWIRAGGPQPSVRRGADGLPAELDALRCLGNAVVPAQAARAFRELLARTWRP